MKAVAVTFVAFLAGCAYSDYRDEPRGELLASFRIIESACSGPIDELNGHFFYVEDNAPGNSLIAVYEYEGGRVVDVAYGGSDAVLKAAAFVRFQPFDYEAEREKATQAMMRGSGPSEITLDGYKWEIYIDTNNGPFRIEVSNPGSDLRNLARYSQDISNLKSVVELFSGYYGRQKIGVL